MFCPFWLQFIIKQVGNYEDYMYILKICTNLLGMKVDFKAHKTQWSKAVCLAHFYLVSVGCVSEGCDCTYRMSHIFELLSPDSLLGFSHHEMTGGFQGWSFLKDSNIDSPDLSILLQLLPQFFSWEIPESITCCQVLGGSWEGKKKSR